MVQTGPGLLHDFFLPHPLRAKAVLLASAAALQLAALHVFINVGTCP